MSELPDHTETETIVALASGAGRAGVAVIRVSGPAAERALRALAGPVPAPRRAVLRTLVDGAGEPIDRALVLWFPGPRSFTGEDCAELHVHGGPAVIETTLAALLAQPGLRLARAGEFTRRAFAHGKLDLTAAEGLADLVDAETEGQRRQALRQLQGGLAAVYEDWRQTLLDRMALVEAEIDFPDEDLPGGLAGSAGPGIRALAAAIAAHLKDGARGERVRDGYRIALVGAPNAGKSSLLNALARRDAAIVSAIPGTTRDVVEVRLVLAGFPVWVADTAGLRAAADGIEAEGVRRALARAEAADLRLAVIAPEAEGPIPEELMSRLQPEDPVILAKADLQLGWPTAGLAGRRRFPVSSHTRAGLEALEAYLAETVRGALAGSEAPALSRARHREELTLAHAALERAAAALQGPPELAAEDLRQAAAALGRLTGRIGVEEVLGAIFASFCIGK